MNRVVVTGINIITPLGLNLSESWENVIKCRSGIKRISLFDPSNCQTQIAGELSADFEDYTENFIKKRIAKQMTRTTKMCYTCAIEAIENNKIDFSFYDKSRCAIILGVVNTGYNKMEQTKNPKDRIIMNMNNAIPAWISLKFGFEGPCYSVSTACASSAYAISLGYDLIKSGSADIVITGGADSTINPDEINGFNELYALSTSNDKPEKASKPFSKDRDGFVIGEGAGIIVLESLEKAKKRDAKIFAEMAGYANTSEGYNIMAPMKDGEGMAKTISAALKNSNVNKNEVDYINAHGTSTMLNDKYETMAIKKVFEDYAKNIPVSSTKSMIGHTIGAAGAIEASITIMSINDNILPATINYDNPDPELDLDYVPNASREKKVNCALSNSFAFGGHNSTLVFKKI